MANNDTQRWFKALVNGDEPELRAAVAGAQSITYTQGAAGGYLVPNEFYETLVLGMAAVNPLLDASAVTLVTKNNARPLSVPAWDLSTFEAQQISESLQQTEQTVPTASNKRLDGYSFRARLQASFEMEQDDFQPVIDQFAKAMGVGFARGVGKALVNGNGTSAPQGLLTGATDSGVTTASNGGVILMDDIENIYFALDREYRQSAKCAWVMADQTYRQVRKAKDTQGRPLINIVDDMEMLMGKRVLIAPSLPSYNASIGLPVKGIVFGDLSHYVVRVSTPTMRRSIENTTGIEFGEAMYSSLMRVDAKVVDPSSSAVLYATIHA